MAGDGDGNALEWTPGGRKGLRLLAVCSANEISDLLRVGECAIT